MSLLRRMRGIVGTALTWATGWGLLGAGLHAVALLLGWNGFMGVTWMTDVLGHALIGLVGGTVFSAGLLLTERRGSLADLSIVRSSLWGTLAGLCGAVTVFAALGGLGMLPDVWPVFLAGSVLGAASGGGMSAIARSADASLARGGDPGRLKAE